MMNILLAYQKCIHSKLNPAYGKHLISQCVQIFEAPRQQIKCVMCHAAYVTCTLSTNLWYSAVKDT